MNHESRINKSLNHVSREKNSPNHASRKKYRGPSVKGIREPHREKKKSFDLGGIEPMTSGLDLPLLCGLSYEVGQRKLGTIKGGESRRRGSKGTYECYAA